MNIKVTLVDLGYELDNCFSEERLVSQYYIRVADPELELLKNTKSLLHLYDDDDDDDITSVWTFVNKLKSELQPHDSKQEHEPFMEVAKADSAADHDMQRGTSTLMSVSSFNPFF